jgi:hypothetical protein
LFAKAIQRKIMEAKTCFNPKSNDNKKRELKWFLKCWRSSFVLKEKG